MNQEHKDWDKVIDFFKEKFTGGEEPEMDTILFLVGVRELGQVKPKFTKDEKVNLMHIATCKLLEPQGFYKFEKKDDEGWPHYKRLKHLPPMKAKEQEEFMKEAIVKYFKENELI
jgi:hypothetical protein